MSLIFLPDNWKRFGSGRKWRCSGPKYLCEVDDAGHTPNYLNVAGTVSKIRRIKSVYEGQIKFGLLDEMGTGIDILVTNSGGPPSGTFAARMSSLSRGWLKRASSILSRKR